jgi:hypothetical protein
MLPSASANAIKVAHHFKPREITNISYLNIHKKSHRATPEMFTKYRQALLLAKPSINTYQQVSKSK